MKTLTWKAVITLAMFLLTGLVMAACGGGGGGSGGGTTTSTGSLSTSLTDSATDEYQAVYVTITRVDVHHDGDGTWETVANPNKTYNLLELVNGVRSTLGIATLDTGHYTQMRLIINESAPDAGLNIFSRRHPHANYLIDLAGNEIPLKVPSGANTGLKIVNGFDINENQTTELILDFDAMRSVVKAGASGQYLLKPTVKVLKTTDYAIVAGVVTDVPPVTTPPTTPTALPGVLITAQTAAPLAADVRDQVVGEAGTTTNDAGAYALFLQPQSYNLVAVKDGFLPACHAVTPAANSTLTVDFSLIAATATGTVTGTVTINSPPGDQWATIDFRQASDCGSGTAMITVRSINLGDGGNYAVTLPTGSYQVVASTFGRVTEAMAVTVLAGTTTIQDVTLDVASP